MAAASFGLWLHLHDCPGDPRASAYNEVQYMDQSLHLDTDIDIIL
jgi:hypothetical protein